MGDDGHVSEITLYVTQSREVRYVSNEVSTEVSALMAGVSYETFLSRVDGYSEHYVFQLAGDHA